MKHIYFIGIGGIGVSGIAQLALRRGDKVSGSDMKESEITRKLVLMGAQVFIGHNGENINGADLVVYSSAIKQDNPEMLAAKERGIPIKRRAEFLSELMSDKKVITITGAHGKTTTSSLASKLLMTSGLNPTVAVGGILRGDGDNVKFGDSPYFVAEADESDGTFLCYEPLYSIITNIDYEHMDFYKTFDNLTGAFSDFVDNTRLEGCVFYFKGDKVLSDIVEKSNVRKISFGFNEEADFYPRDILLSQCRLEFSCINHGRDLGRVVLNLNGRHNILNGLAVIALGMELGIDFEKIKIAFGNFRGVERRFEIKYESDEILVVDDYAHHPTEIAATVEAAKTCPRSRLVVVFQPHRYSRTKLLLDKFPESFIKSDYTVVTDIYAAGEEPIEGISAQDIVCGIRQKTDAPVEYVAKGDIVRYLKGVARKGDLVLFLGAGDITKISDEFAKSFQK